MESSSVVNFSSALAKEEGEVDVSVPTGYRFLPSDLELVRNYLSKKIANQKLPTDLPVVEFDIYATEPWNLPENNKIDKINSKRSYYFVRFLDEIGRVRKRIVNPSSVADDNGGRRRKGGFWEKVGEGRRCIRDEKNKSIGVKKSFVFHAYLTETSSSTTAMKTWKTNWILDEYSLNSQRNQPWVLCIVRKKVGDEDEVKLLASIEQLSDKIVERPNYVDCEVEIMEEIKTIQERIKENQIKIWDHQYELFTLNERRVRFRMMKQLNIARSRIIGFNIDKWNEVKEGKITLDDYVAFGNHLVQMDKRDWAAIDAEVAVIRAGSYYRVEQKFNRFKTERKNKKRRVSNN